MRAGDDDVSNAASSDRQSRPASGQQPQPLCTCGAEASKSRPIRHAAGCGLFAAGWLDDQLADTVPPAGVREVRCFTVDCADCGEAAWSDDFTPHFPASEGVKKLLATLRDDHEWSTDGALLCRDCTTKRECVAQGHDWNEWGDPVNGRQLRACQRCPEYEFQTAVTDA